MKLQAAQKWQIHFTCIADGKLLDFMHVRDICTLFGNALDNAIESVVMLKDPEKRLIQMQVLRQKNMIYITVRNYTESHIKKQDGSILPRTTKKDTENRQRINGLTNLQNRHILCEIKVINR